jgi:hypothetical protein
MNRQVARVVLVLTAPIVALAVIAMHSAGAGHGMSMSTAMSTASALGTGAHVVDRGGATDEIGAVRADLPRTASAICVAILTIGITFAARRSVSRRRSLHSIRSCLIEPSGRIVGRSRAGPVAPSLEIRLRC